MGADNYTARVTKTKLNEQELAFYTWYHLKGKSQYLIDSYREAFLAGWEAGREGTWQFVGA